MPRPVEATSLRARLLLGLALVAAATLVAGAALARTDKSGIREGGTFRIALDAPLDSIDPALAYSLAGWALVDTTCARLLRYPDKARGLLVVPDVARAHPRVSRDGKTYTFTLRRGFRFSNGTPVRANAFAGAINRVLAPAMKSPGAPYMEEIVGADAVQAGRRASATGVVARGLTLVIRLKRPTPDFPARLTMPFFCAVPPSLPADPEGSRAFPAAGPYYVAEYRPGQRLVLRRNRFYGGTRPRHVEGFTVDLRAISTPEAIDRVDRSQVDWAAVDSPPLFDPARRLAAKYGVNRSRFFVRPGTIFRGLALNTSRPLFRNNARLRRAVNFAIDRPAFRRIASGTSIASRLTDQYLPPWMAGARDAAIYPLAGPNVRKARALAKGRTRGGKAVLYTFANPISIAHGQVLRQNLAKIGLDLDVKTFQPGALFAKLGTPGEPYDIGPAAWAPDYLDPYQYINRLLESRYIGRGNNARFDSPLDQRLMRKAASLRGSARYRAYGELDVKLARDAAPMVAVAVTNEAVLVSNRVGCVVLRPSLGLNLAAACLKR